MPLQVNVGMLKRLDLAKEELKMVWVPHFTSLTSLATPPDTVVGTGRPEGVSEVVCPSSCQGQRVDSEVNQAWVKNSFVLPASLLPGPPDVGNVLKVPTCIGASVSTPKSSACEEEAWTAWSLDAQNDSSHGAPSNTCSTRYRKGENSTPRLSCGRWSWVS